MENKGAIIAVSSVGVLLALSVIKKSYYEAYLRLHQALTIVLMYGAWLHIGPQRLLPKLYFYSIPMIFGLSSLIIGVLALRRNGVLATGTPRATISASRGVVIVHISLTRPIRIEAGQQINAWFAIGLRALLQSHPFVVASWSDAPQTSLDLLIEPRGGMTRKLLLRAMEGPHTVREYEVVLMVASGFGIAAHLPYLKQLLHGYNSRRVHTRRIHLVWELKTLEKLLNAALDDDTLDDGYILQISIFVEDVKRDDKISRRAKVIKGLPKWNIIVQEEAAGQYIKKVQDESITRKDMIVTVSASSRIRLDLRNIVRQFLDDKVEMIELDYQPNE
ncbi:Ferric reductase transmembrane component [Paramyrothecium foliicola]|nr:Ferric reductase transmembrane component [Paramyrothecium foliicola]